MSVLPTLRQLRYLIAVVDHRHFGRAAEACHVTQSTLSAGIQELEGLLGVQLVERSRKRVVPTSLGAQVADRARRLVREAGDLVDLCRHSGPMTGPMRIGVIPTIGPFLLPRLMPVLRREWPDLAPYLREDQTARLLDQLARGDLDVAILAFPWPVGDLAVEEVGDDPFQLALPPDHGLATADRVPVAALADETLLLLEEGHCLREHALAACEMAARQPAHAVYGTSLITLVQMVASGLGVTLLPRIALAAEVVRSADVVLRPLADGGPPRRIGLAWRRESARAADGPTLAAVVRRVVAGTEAAEPLS